MKYCKDCRYLANDMVLCTSPYNEVSLVTGEPEGTLAKQNRLPASPCGPEAQLFEEREVVKKSWWMF